VLPDRQSDASFPPSAVSSDTWLMIDMPSLQPTLTPIRYDTCRIHLGTLRTPLQCGGNCVQRNSESFSGAKSRWWRDTGQLFLIRGWNWGWQIFQQQNLQSIDNTLHWHEKPLKLKWTMINLTISLHLLTWFLFQCVFVVRCVCQLHY